MSDDSGREFISAEQALAMLPDKPRIHTFRYSAVALIGADWDREEIVALIKKSKPELTGEAATGMGHGLAVEDKHGFLFIETIRATAPARLVTLRQAVFRKFKHGLV